VTLAGNTSEGEVSLTLDVNATPVDNYASMTSQLTDRKQELEPVSKSNLTQTLTEVSGTITEIQTAWEEDNYLEAKRLYNDAQNKLDYVENNKGSTEGGDTGGNNGGTDQGDDGQETGGDQSDDPGNQGGDQGGADTGGPSTTQNEGGGGLPIIPIVVVILVLVIIGFVVYESYIPEEGDPLYGVLGEE
jgi:cobalamin biosynthesis Mg chelatase CobN